MVDPDSNLAAAEKVAEILSRHKVDAVVIGAVALAAYRYIRQTDDIDLGVNADVPTLRRIVTSLHEAGCCMPPDRRIHAPRLIGHL